MDNRRRYKNGRRKAPAYIPQGDPQALATPVEELGLHERTVAALKAGGVNTAADIAGRYMRDMYKVQGIGKRDIFAMQGALKKLNLTFRPEEQKQPQGEAAGEEKPVRAEQEKKPAQDRGKRQEKRQPERRENQVKNSKEAEAPKPRESARFEQENGGRDEKNAKNKGKDNREKGGKKSAELINKELSRLYAGLTINEIIMGGKKKRPTFVPYPKEGIKQGDLIKFYRAGKWGYKDWKGNVVIHPEYDEAFAFHEGRAGVEENGLIGYIDKANNKVIECKYDCGTSFSEGLAAVSVGEKSGYIDENGNPVTEMEFDVATPFCEGKAVVRENDRWGILDRETMKVLWR